MLTAVGSVGQPSVLSKSLDSLCTAMQRTGSQFNTNCCRMPAANTERQLAVRWKAGLCSLCRHRFFWWPSLNSPQLMWVAHVLSLDFLLCPCCFDIHWLTPHWHFQEKKETSSPVHLSSSVHLLKEHFMVKNCIQTPLVLEAATNGVSLKAVWCVFNEHWYTVRSISVGSLAVTTRSCNVDVWR